MSKNDLPEIIPVEQNHLSVANLKYNNNEPLENTNFNLLSPVSLKRMEPKTATRENLSSLAINSNLTIPNSRQVLDQPSKSSKLINQNNPIPQQMGQDLAWVHQQYQEQGNAAFAENNLNNFVLQVEQGKVAIEAIATEETSTLVAQLEELGLQDTSSFENVVSGWLPIDAIGDMAQLSSLNFARPTYKPMSNVGSVTSQGDSALNADNARSTFKVDGSDTTIGVLSNSYNLLDGEEDGIASGDLPSSGVNVLEEGPTGVSNSPAADEGRAMIELIRDIAPGADFAFHTAFGGRANFAEGINELVDAGADIIVDDVGYPNQTFFQDGIIAQAANAAAEQGVPYFSSAGNDGRQSYQSEFRAADENPLSNPDYVFHNFDPSNNNVDSLQEFTLDSGESITLSFQWSQPYASVGPVGSNSDLDIFLLNESGNELLNSSTNFNVGADPSELLSFQNQSSQQQTYNLAIGRFKPEGGSNPELIKYVEVSNNFNFGNSDNLEFDTNSSTSFGHPNAEQVAGVGASFFQDTPEFGTTPPQTEEFSSAGGVPIIFDQNGNRLSSREIRQQPRFTAPDGTNTTFFRQDSSADSDNFPNFFGTSAAAPHAAGVTALMQEAAGGPDSTTPAEIYQTLENTAINIGPDGFDFDSGNGLIQADEAVEAIAEENDSTSPENNLISNGSFENGNLSNWNLTTLEGSDGQLFVTDLPANESLPSSGIPAAGPGNGNFYAAVDQAGPGGYAIEQSFTVPEDATGLNYSFDLFGDDTSGSAPLNSGNFNFTGEPTQYARVELLDGSGNLIDTLAEVGDPENYRNISGEIADPINGDNSYTFRFEHVDNQNFFHTALDNISLVATSESPGDSPELILNNFADFEAPEGDSGETTFSFTVTLNQAPSQQVTVDFATAEGTATAGEDYQSRSGTLTFQQGETEQTIEVPVFGDTNEEPNETFSVELSNPSDGLTLDDRLATGTIQNDDESQQPTETIIQPLGPQDNDINLGGDAESNTEINDFGGNDTYTILPDLAGQVVLSDNQSSTINLPDELTVTGARFVSNGVEFDINGNTIRLLGALEQFTFVFGGSPINPEAGTELSFQQTAEAFGTTVPPADQDTPNQATNTGDINPDGTVGNTGTATDRIGQSDVTVSADIEETLISLTDPNSTGNLRLRDGTATGTIQNDDSGGEPTEPQEVILIQTASPDVVGSGAGNDTYIISGSLLTGSEEITISDAQDSNSIQLTARLEIQSSVVAANALQLKLTNGAVININEADDFTYEPGGNAVAGIDQADDDFNAFVEEILGTNVPTGDETVTGGAVTISDNNQMELIDLTGQSEVTATADTAETFVFEFTSETAVGIANSEDARVTISGFDPTQDLLRFEDSSDPVISKEDFLHFANIASDQFAEATRISFFDPNPNNNPQAGQVVLDQITDASLGGSNPFFEVV